MIRIRFNVDSDWMRPMAVANFALKLRLVRKRRINRAANRLFHILTLGMFPHLRLQVLAVDKDEKTSSKIIMAHFEAAGVFRPRPLKDKALDSPDLDKVSH